MSYVLVVFIHAINILTHNAYSTISLTQFNSLEECVKMKSVVEHKTASLKRRADVYDISCEKL